MTHNTSLGIASAAAVAAVVSAGINGQPLAEALALGVQVARQAQAQGHWVAGATIGARLDWTSTLRVDGDREGFARMLYELIGTSVASQESVVVSFALARQVALGQLPAFEALCIAAGLGGDTDTIAAILGAMLGACLGMEIWPGELIGQVRKVNELDLQPLVEQLLALR